MSCMACGAEKKRYVKFRRMKSHDFTTENKRFLTYKPIHTPSEIFIDKETYKLGHFFLVEDIQKNHSRKTSYENSEGFFKLKISEIPQTKFDSRNMLIKKFKNLTSEKNFKKILTEYEPPLNYRWSFWYVLGTEDQILSEDDYQRLVRSYKKDVESIVRKDVPRTFSTNKFFGQKIEEIEVGRELLYQVCKAVGTYFTEVGYCQGLNFLAGFLLQISGGNQMECVNVLISLMTNSRFLLLGLYDNCFPLVSFLKFLFHKKMKKINKKVESSLKESMLPDDVWLTKWYISLMTGYLPKYHAARLMDFLFAHDIFALVSFIVALIETNKQFVVKKPMEDINEMVSFLDAKSKTGGFLYLREPEFLIKRAKRYLLSRDEILEAFEEFHEDPFSYGKEEFKRYEPHFKDYLLSKKSRQVEFKVFDFAAESVLPSESERFSHRRASGKLSIAAVKPIKNLGDIDEERPYDIESSPIRLKNQGSEENTKNNSLENHRDIQRNDRRKSSFFKKNERWSDQNPDNLFNKRPSAVYVKPRKLDPINVQ